MKIYHNPECGTSRNVLNFIQEAGIEPEVILYLETPPSKEKLTKLIKEMGIDIRDLLRKNVPPYQEFEIETKNHSTDELLELMVTHPILINRPIVVSSLGTKLCRPSETVLELIPTK